MFWKAPILPVAFRGSGSVGGDGGVGDGLYSVGGGVAGVSGHVGDSGCLTSRMSGSSGRTFIGVAGGGVGGKCGAARRAAFYLTTHPGTGGFNGFARPVVLRALLLEEWQHMLGALGGPERK